MRLLKSIYNSIFGKSKKDVSKLVSSSFSLSDMASLADGMEFLPTFLLRTPVSILKRNGEIYRGDTPPPVYCEIRDGIWIPWVEHKGDLFLKEIRDTSTVSSDVGYVKREEYLKFAIPLLEFFEGDKSIHEKMEFARDLFNSSAEQKSMEAKLCQNYGKNDICEVMSEFISKHDKFEYFKDKKGHLKIVDGINSKNAAALESSGIFTINDLIEASPIDLIKINGIGERTISRITSDLSAYLHNI